MGSSESTGRSSQDEQHRDEGLGSTAKAIGAVAGLVAVVALGISTLVASESAENSSASNKKKMRAPGKPETYIDRDDFENNPSGYFRDLRNKK